MSEQPRGFKPLMTRAPLVERLAASPSEYDAAPTYLITEMSEHSEEIKRELARRVGEEIVQGTRGDTLGRQARIAIELAAPVGLGLVRSYALVGAIGHFVLAANPVVAVLSAPALFFTGKKLITDMRRAFSVDPKVREFMSRAARFTESGDYNRAQELLKEALEVDIDPTYQRNGDLYLNLGMVQVQAGRPREAMVSFAKASVLFGPDDPFRYQRGDQTAVISKRGLAELMAIAAIDSFARTEEGLDEWNAILGDFARSCEKRFNHFADIKDRGRLFGLFGVDHSSADMCRELAAKVQFFGAKMQLRRAGLGDTPDTDAIVDGALADLAAAGLEPGEHFQALLEQAQFYCGLASKKPDGASALRGLKLLETAAGVIESTDPGMAAQVRAEAATFALDAMPLVVAHGGETSALRSELEKVLQRLDALLSSSTVRQLPYGDMMPGWIAEKRYHLADGLEARRQAIGNAADAYRVAGEPVAAMQSGLRLAYLAETRDDMLAAIDRIEQSARDILSHPKDPVSMAYAAKYLQDTAEVTGRRPENLHRDVSARHFLDAAAHVRAERRFVPFHLNGRPVVHPAPVAETILLGQAAQEFAKAGQGAEAVRYLEQVRHRSSDGASDEVLLALEVEEAAIRLATGDSERAKETLERVERTARHHEMMDVQRRALELLHDSSRDGLGLAPGVQGGDPAGELTAPTSLAASLRPNSRHGMLDHYAGEREQLLEAGDQIIGLIRDAGLADRLRHGDVSMVDRIDGRLQRVREGKFRIAIVGEFSAGKSTLLNAMLGEAVLPAAIRPTTAALNRILWGDEPSIVVGFQDGSEEQTDIKQLKLFVTEKGNPDNERGVAEVVIRHPLPLLLHGAELIDTPGVSSLIEAHTKITYSLIPSCDAVVLVATGRQPFSDSVGNFLQDLRRFVSGKVFYLLNKIDQLDEARVPDAVRFAHERVSEKVEGARVFPVSSYAALMSRRLSSGTVDPDDLDGDPRLGHDLDPDHLFDGSGFGEFEDAMGRFLERHRGVPLLLENAVALLGMQMETERAIAVDLQSAQMDARQAADTFQRLAAEHAQRKGATEATLSALETDLRSTLDSIAAKAPAALHGQADTILSRVPITSETIATGEAVAELKKRLAAELRNVAEEVIAQASAGMENALTVHRYESRKVLMEMQRELHEEFAIAFELPQSTTLMEFEHQHIELDGSGIGVAGNVLIGGVLGFLGGLLLGPIGVVLAIFGSGFLGNYFDNAKVEAARSKIHDRLEDALRRIADELSSQLSGQADAMTSSSVEAIAGYRDEILAEFDAQLNSLVEEREEDETKVRDRRVLLQSLQRDAADARNTLENLLARHREGNDGD